MIEHVSTKRKTLSSITNGEKPNQNKSWTKDARRLKSKNPKVITDLLFTYKTF